MKYWAKFLILFFSLVIILICGFIFYWYIHGEKIIIHRLQEITGRRVSLSSFDYIPPFTLRIGRLKIDDLLTVSSLDAVLSPWSFVKRGLFFKNIVLYYPKFSYKRNIFVGGDKAKPSKTISFSPGKYLRKAQGVQGNLFRLGVQNLQIKNGRFEFVDRGVIPEGLRFSLKDIDLRVDNLFIPFLATDFFLSAKIPWSKGGAEGVLRVEGWLNIFKKSMEAKVSVEDIDGLYFYPYYAQWVNLEKSRIEKATLNFYSDIHGLNNLATVHCKVEIKDIVFKLRSPEEVESKEERIARAVLDIFKKISQDNKIVFEHTFQTRMDRFEFGLNQLKDSLEERIRGAKGSNMVGGGELFLFPARLLVNFFKGVTDLTSAVVKGTLGVGLQVGKTIGDSFKKDKVPVQEGGD